MFDDFKPAQSGQGAMRRRTNVANPRRLHNQLVKRTLCNVKSTSHKLVSFVLVALLAWRRWKRDNYDM